jgi:hypothetical protein
MKAAAKGTVVTTATGATIPVVTRHFDANVENFRWL